MSNEEIRYRRFELRAAEGLGEGVVRGIVTTFDDPYPIGRGRREVITRSTFDLGNAIPLFYEHNWSAGPIGVSRSLTAGPDGLEAEFELFIEDDPRARSVWRAMKARALKEFSIGFLPQEITEERSTEHTTEKITKGDLIEVSSVVRGANPGTETLSTRAVVPGAPDPNAPLDPATGLPAVEEEKPTKAQLLAQVAEAVQLAIDLDMAEALPKIVKQYLDLLVEAAPAPVVDPNAPPAAPAAPAAPPAARSFPADLSPSLFRALSV